MIIPIEQLLPDTLRALIEEFISRDGAVQGHADTPLEQKVSAVMSQLKSGTAVIVFDEPSESCSIVAKDSLKKDSSSIQGVVEE